MSEITKHRGDTKPIVFQLWEDKGAGTRLDITGFSAKFTVNSKEAPLDADAPEFSLDGVIAADPTTGLVTFSPTANQMDLTPKIYYFDLQITDAGGYISTEMLDKFIVKQDITK